MKAALFCFIFATIIASTAHAQIVADLAANYQGGTVGNTMTPLSDTHGTGTWLYEAGTVNNAFTPTSVSSLSALAYISNANGGSASDIYGTFNDYQVPAVANLGIFGDGSSNPPSDYLAVHPNSGTSSVVTQWTAGTGETGTLSVSFDLSRIGVYNPGNGAGADSFVVLENGSSVLYQDDNMALGTDTGIQTVTVSGVTLGTTLDFVVSTTDGFGYNLAYLNADISEVPEPSTWALLGLGSVALFFVLRRRALRA